MGFVFEFIFFCFVLFFFSMLFSLKQGWEWETIHTVAAVLLGVCVVGVLLTVLLEHFFHYRPLMSQYGKAIDHIKKNQV